MLLIAFLLSGCGRAPKHQGKVDVCYTREDGEHRCTSEEEQEETEEEAPKWDGGTL